jgi:hypothetical protein
MIDPLKNPGRYPTGKNFLTHGLARAKPVHSVGPTRSDPRKKKIPSKKTIKKTAKNVPGHSPTPVSPTPSFGLVSPSPRNPMAS